MRVRFLRPVAIACSLCLLALPACGGREKTIRPEALGTLTVASDSGQSSTLSAEDLAGLKRESVEIAVGSDQDATYEGVPLVQVLRAAGIGPGNQEGKKRQHLQQTQEVVVEAADGYRVVFPAAEVDPGTPDKMILLADRKDGKPLGDAGPYKIVQAGSEDESRWVRQVRSISVRAGSRRGRIYLVGMGPGNPDLVTPRAAKILAGADRVFCFDYLEHEVSPFVRKDVLEVAPSFLMGGGTRPEVFLFAAGVRRTVAKDKTVVFAAAGDPMIFCPWAWVTEQFAHLGPTVVPGLSSFNAANAALAKEVASCSGSLLLSDGRDLGTPDEHGRMSTTLVLFVHTTSLRDLVPRLLARYPEDTPMAIVCNAGYANGQRLIRATLGTVLGKLEGEQLPHLHVVYAGDSLKQQDHSHEHPHVHSHHHSHEHSH